jgi:hypothetical protein
MEYQVTGWVHIAVGIAEVVLGIVIAIKGLRRVPVPAVNTWARRHGVAIDNVTGPYVEHYLTRGRRIRASCFLVPLAVDMVLQLVAGLYGVWGHDWVLEDQAGTLISFAVLAYFGGAVVAELTWRPRRVQAVGPQAAMAVARDLSAYVPRWVTLWQRAAAAATVVLIPVVPLVADDRDLVWAVLSGLTAVAVTVVAELARRRVIDRRQAVMAPEWLAVDDAVRSTSAHILSGIGVLLVMLELSGQLGRVLPEALDGPAEAVAIGVSMLALVTWVVGIALWLQLMQPSWWPVRRFPVPA